MDIFGRYNNNNNSTKIEYINNGLSKGLIDMNNNKIINLITPTEDNDAVTKSYVDNKKISTPIEDDDPVTKLYVDHRNEDLDMNNKKIINLPEPIENSEPVTKGYLESRSVGSSELKTAKGLEIFSTNHGYSNITNSWSDFIDPEDEQREITLTSEFGGHYKRIDESIRGVFLDYDFKDTYIFKAITIHEREGKLDRSSSLSIILFYRNNEVYQSSKGAGRKQMNIKADRFQLIMDIEIPHTQFNYVEFEYKEFFDNLNSFREGYLEMIGNLNLNNNKITNLGNPTHLNHAVNKRYTDNKIIEETNILNGLINDRILRILHADLRFGINMTLEPIDRSKYSLFLIEYYLYGELYTGIVPIEGGCISTFLVDTIYNSNFFTIAAISVDYSEGVFNTNIRLRNSNNWGVARNLNNNENCFITKIYLL